MLRKLNSATWFKDVVLAALVGGAIATVGLKRMEVQAQRQSSLNGAETVSVDYRCFGVTEVKKFPAARSFSYEQYWPQGEVLVYKVGPYINTQFWARGNMSRHADKTSASSPCATAQWKHFFGGAPKPVFSKLPPS